MIGFVGDMCARRRRLQLCLRLSSGKSQGQSRGCLGGVADVDHRMCWAGTTGMAVMHVIGSRGNTAGRGKVDPNLNMHEGV